MTPARAAVVVLAGGSGSRVGAATNKVLLPLGGLPILAHSVRTALAVEGVHRLVVVVRADERQAVEAALAPVIGPHDVWLVTGGAERHDSEWAAIRALRPDIEAGELEVVAIHDAARPLADAAMFRNVIDAAAEHGAAVPGVVLAPLNERSGPVAPGPLAGMQTPQAFGAPLLLAAYTRADDEGFRGTDTAACIEHASPEVEVRLVAGDARNLKVTFPEDVAVAERLLRSD